jgi:hypothetical protein
MNYFYKDLFITYAQFLVPSIYSTIICVMYLFLLNSIYTIFGIISAFIFYFDKNDFKKSN